MSPTFVITCVFIGIAAIAFGLGYVIRRRDIGSKAAARDARRGFALALVVSAIGFGPA